jgi:predicted phage terminase large subunit-like protein
VSEIEQKRLYLDGKTRESLTPFIIQSFVTLTPAVKYLHNWHIDAIAWHLEQCAKGDIKRLLITVPPRYLKSICASVAFPAWVLGRDPSKRIVCASYSENLAGVFSRYCRTVMQSSWYRRVFPLTRLGTDKNTELDFVTTQHGYRFSTSVGGTLTGRGGNIIILDDPLKPEDAMSEAKRSAVNEWFDRTLYSRLDDKRNDVIILIMQRLHVEDLAGYVMQREAWTHLNLPAMATDDQQILIGDGVFHKRKTGDLLHEARENEAVLAATKNRQGSFVFSAQYQQCPVPPDGEIIKWEWFRVYDSPPLFEPGDRIVQSWDTASKAEELNDYSVCTTWHVKGNQYYLLHVTRAKLQYPELKRTVLEHAMSFNANVLVIEDKGSGTILIQDIRENVMGVPSPVAFLPNVDKQTRMSTQSSKIEAGQVHLPRQAEWLGDFHDEVLQFPHGRHDDQVDSLSQFLNWVEERKGNRWAVQQIYL